MHLMAILNFIWQLSLVDTPPVLRTKSWEVLVEVIVDSSSFQCRMRDGRKKCIFHFSWNQYMRQNRCCIKSCYSYFLVYLKILYSLWKVNLLFWKQSILKENNSGLNTSAYSYIFPCLIINQALLKFLLTIVVRCIGNADVSYVFISHNPICYLIIKTNCIMA